MNIKIKFNSLEEFLAELQKDIGPVAGIHRSIVRVTGERKAPSAIPIIHLTLVATYRREDEVIELRRRCGDLWESGGRVNDDTENNYDTGVKTIQEFCESHCLEVRAGVYERMDSS